MRRIRILHTTHYDYEFEVRFLPHTLHLRPREGHDIRIEEAVLRITPDFSIDWRRDLFNNSVAVVSFANTGRVLEITSEVVVAHYADEAPILLPAESARRHPFQYGAMERVSLQPYQQPVYAEDQRTLAAWISEVWKPGQTIDTVKLLDTLNRQISARIGYIVRHEPGVQTPAETIRSGKGSCRDLATLFIEACRFCGLGSRFVSGYSAAGADPEQPATTHAWSEVYLPGCGWVGFDSTSGERVSGDHIAVAVHRHPEAVPPVAGDFVGPANSQPIMRVDVEVSLV